MWSVIGALAQATSLPVTTGVTCPTVRIHPAIVAQAAATSGVLHDGRFNLGVGSGEALNEHILGDHWPEADIRLEMLEEAVEVIRTLWQGGQQSHYGLHYAVENARSTTSRTCCRSSSSRASARRPSSSPPGSATGSPRLRPTRTRSTSTAQRVAPAPCTPVPRSVTGRARKQPARPRRTQARGLAQRSAPRRAGAGPSDAGALRAGVRARAPRAIGDPGRPGSRPARRVAQRPTRTPAWTSCSSSRSAPNRTCSSPNGPPRS